MQNTFHCCIQTVSIWIAKAKIDAATAMSTMCPEWIECSLTFRRKCTGFVITPLIRVAIGEFPTGDNISHNIIGFWLGRIVIKPTEIVELSALIMTLCVGKCVRAIICLRLTIKNRNRSDLFNICLHNGVISILVWSRQASDNVSSKWRPAHHSISLIQSMCEWVLTFLNESRSN